MTNQPKPIVPTDYSRIVVIDIETLGKKSTSKIATIGAVVVDMLSGDRLGEFYVKVSLTQFRSICADVSDWWAKQSHKNPQAHAEVFGNNDDRVPLERALTLLNEFIESSYHDGIRPQVMGNGSEFDNVILVDAYNQLEIKPGWHFCGNQSLRTAVLFGRVILGIDPKYELPFNGIRHHALDDARHEADYLIHIARAFKERIS